MRARQIEWPRKIRPIKHDRMRLDSIRRRFRLREKPRAYAQDTFLLFAFLHPDGECPIHETIFKYHRALHICMKFIDNALRAEALIIRRTDFKHIFIGYDMPV